MFKKLMVTFGGLGLIPAMPGTYASFAAALIYYGVWRFVGEHDTRTVMAVATFLCVIVAARTYHWAKHIFGSDDPRQFVLDEVAGQWLTLLFVPFSANPLAYMAAGFFLFRAFDVSKPFPIGRIERIRGWAGVLFDDIAAAIYAGVGLRVLIYLVSLLMGTTTSG